MVEFPAAIPVTAPVTAFTVATDGVRLFQVPPLLPLLVNVVADPAQTVVGPLIVPEFGRGLTVIAADEIEVPQVLVTVYFMVAVPAALPVTTPVLEFTVATAVLLLLQVPTPGLLLENVVVATTQTVEDPLTIPAFGSGFTVMSFDEVNVPQP
jgi:hypothetical protein